MSIDNELSGEIAAAVLSQSNKKESLSGNDLKDVILKVHSTLRHLTSEERKRTRSAKAKSPTSAGSAPTGVN